MRNRAARGRQAVGAAIAYAAFGLVSCGAPSDHEKTYATGPGGANTTAARAAIAGNTEAGEFDLEAELHGIVKQVRGKYGGQLGIAVTTAEGTVHVGARGGGPAWSTVKVPIAIAAIREGADKSLVDLAIKESDNDAAYALWSKVKWSEKHPTAALNRVLADADSEATWQKPDANGDIKFGYARWLLPEQAKFGAHLACIPEASYVYGVMDDIVEWQQYGLTKFPNIHAKGGWGYDPELDWYTQRQFGTMEIEGGAIGIAITSVRTDAAQIGEAEADAKAVAALDATADALERLLSDAVHNGDLKPVAACIPRATATPTASPSAKAATRET